MARIPLQVAGSRLETGRMVDYSGLANSSVNRVVEGFGDTLTAVGERYQQQAEEVENFDAVQKFNQMKIAADGDLPDIQSKAPANGLGYHDAALEAFKKRETEFLAGVPERLKPRFQALVETERAQFSQRQAGAELETRNSWYRTGVETAIGRGQEQVYNNPGALDAARQETFREIDASGLPVAEKEALRLKAEQGLANGLAARTMQENPEALAGSMGVAVTAETTKAGQSYLDVASSFLGASEGADGGALAAFIKKSCGILIDPKQTAWCAAYVNAVLGSQGGQGTGKLNAKSFLTYGAEVDQPSPGDIVVLSRGDPNGAQGHVGFFAGYDANGNVKVLGGNQGNQVSVASFDKDKVLGFRRPPEVGSSEAAGAQLSKLPGGGPSGGMVVTPLDPRFASLPFADRLKLASQARSQVTARQQVAETQRKAEYGAYNDRLDLGILTGDVASEEQILSDPVLDDGDKAARLRSFRKQKTEANATDVAVKDYLAGSYRDLNPLDGDQRKTANAVFDVLNKGMEGLPDDVRDQQTQAFIKQTGIIPDPVQADIRKGAYSTKPAEFATAMDAAGRIEDAAPISFDSMPNGQDVRRDLTSFRYMVNDLGMSSTDAAKRVLEQRTPEFQKNTKLWEADANKIASKLGAGDVTNEFDPGWFSAEPGAGADPATQGVLLSEYRDAFRDQFIRTGGDEGQAKKLAAQEIKRTWGVSTVSGDAQLMKYPPERFYPPVDGGYGYLRQDALKVAAEVSGAEMPRGKPLPPSTSTGELSPLKPGEFRDNGDGSYSTELLTTIQDADGKWINAPSLWKNETGWVDLGEDEDAISTAVSRYEQSGAKLDRFGSVAEAEAAAKSKSAAGGVSAKSNRDSIANVFLRPSPATAADIRAGRPPRYRLFYERKAGDMTIIDEVPGLWAMERASIDNQKQAAQAATMDAAVQQRAVESEYLSGTNRDEAQDQFLNPPAAAPVPAAADVPKVAAPTINQPGSTAAINDRLQETREGLFDAAR